MDCSYYSIILPLFPLQAKLRGIRELWIGIVLSSLAVGNILGTLVVNQLTKNFTKKRILVVNTILLVFVVGGFGVVDLSSNNTLFIAVSLIFRMVQGIEFGINVIILSTMTTMMYPCEKEMIEKISSLNIWIQLGFMAGPILGSIMYNLFGYIWMFVILAALLLISLILLLVFFPKDETIFEPSSSSALNTDSDKEYKLFAPLKSKNFAFTFFFTTLTQMAYLYMTTGYSIHMETDFHLSSEVIGFVYPSGSLIIVLICLFYGKVNWKVGGVFHFILAAILMIIGLITVGPSTVIGLPNQLWISIIGLEIIYLAQSFNILPQLPVFIELISDFDPTIPERDLKQIASSYRNLFYSIISLIGPSLGGLMTDLVGYSAAMAAYGGFLLVFMILFIIFGNGHFYIASQFSSKNTSFNQLNEESV